jgi:hypothetical protein
VLKISDREIHYVDPLRGSFRTPVEDFLKWQEIEPFFMSVQSSEAR